VWGISKAYRSKSAPHQDSQPVFPRNSAESRLRLNSTQNIGPLGLDIVIVEVSAGLERQNRNFCGWTIVQAFSKRLTYVTSLAESALQTLG